MVIHEVDKTCQDVEFQIPFLFSDSYGRNIWQEESVLCSWYIAVMSGLFLTATLISYISYKDRYARLLVLYLLPLLTLGPLSNSLKPFL